MAGKAAQDTYSRIGVQHEVGKQDAYPTIGEELASRMLTPRLAFSMGWQAEMLTSLESTGLGWTRILHRPAPRRGCRLADG